MKILVRILNWLFIAYAVIFPVAIIAISIRGGIGQGLQFLVLPFIIAYFLILFWWTKHLLHYISFSTQTISKMERSMILLQTLCLFVFVVMPLIVFTAYVIWNRFARPNPLETIATLCFAFQASTGIIFMIAGIVLGIRYKHKLKQV